MAARPDEFLGSEEELLTRLEVSRPTLRQAARLLEQEQLLSVRRGVGGGFYARQPTTEAVSHMASVYLRAAGIDLPDLQRSHALVATELARLAACNPSAADRAAIFDFVEEYQARPRGEEQRWFHVVALDFGRHLAELAASPSLSLFESVLRDVAMKPLGPRIFQDARRISASRKFHRRLALAVRAGDDVAAVRINDDFTRRVRRWVSAELPRATREAVS